ncbi:hypothetical protein Q9189_006902 [Teloschistes chrysophthalmus]
MAPARNQTTQSLMRDPRSQPVEVVIPTLSKKPSRKESQKKFRSSSKKLTKRRDSERTEPPLPSGPMVDRRDPLNERILPGATAASIQHLHNPPNDRGDVPSYYFQQHMSTTSLQPERGFTAIPKGPTLSTKRSAIDPILPRRKSSKRKADDHAREQEIKAMTSPIPIPKRPTSGASGILARDSRRIPGNLNRNFERPTSEISIPPADSIASSPSMAPDSHGFRISAIDALSPRPTIRYSENPRLANGSGSLGPSRTSTRKEKYPAITEEITNPRKRIEDLANDMDAGSLRELMERDRRRTEKNRRSEREKLQRTLQRKADKQRAQESADEMKVGLGIEEQHSLPTTQTRGFAAEDEREVPLSESWLKELDRERGMRTPESWLKDPSRENLLPASPFRDPVAETERSRLEAPTPIDDREEPILETATAVRLSQASMSPPTSPAQHPYEPSTLSHIASLAARSTPDIPERIEDQRRDSDTSTRLSSNWKSIFRRSGTRNRSSTERGRTTTSEFANTSRESFARQMPLSAFNRIPRARSGTPVRTQSRFKEDLPELPISPPDSRMQSPEASGQFPSPRLDQIHDSITSNPQTPEASGQFPSPRLDRMHESITSNPQTPEAGGQFPSPRLDRMHDSITSNPQTPEAAEQFPSPRLDRMHDSITSNPTQPLEEIHPAFREEVALSRHQSLNRGSSDMQPGALMSQSLASVDSEGSWLTGRPVKRSSQNLVNPLRESASSLQKRLRDLGAASDEELRSAESDLVRRDMSRQRTVRGRHRSDESGFAGDSDDEMELQAAPEPIAEEEGKWHGAVGRQPTIVRQGARARSREGLLNDFIAGEESQETSPIGESPGGQTESPDSPSIQRATSVDFGKQHARHISAGSARLLHLPARSSAEVKRLSASSGERSLRGSPSPRQVYETRESDVD